MREEMIARNESEGEYDIRKHISEKKIVQDSSNGVSKCGCDDEGA